MTAINYNLRCQTTRSLEVYFRKKQRVTGKCVATQEMVSRMMPNEVKIQRKFKAFFTKWVDFKEKISLQVVFFRSKLINSHRRERMK